MQLVERYAGHRGLHLEVVQRRQREQHPRRVRPQRLLDISLLARLRCLRILWPRWLTWYLQGIVIRTGLRGEGEGKEGWAKGVTVV